MFYSNATSNNRSFLNQISFQQPPKYSQPANELAKWAFNINVKRTVFEIKVFIATTSDEATPTNKSTVSEKKRWGRESVLIYIITKKSSTPSQQVVGDWRARCFEPAEPSLGSTNAHDQYGLHLMVSTVVPLSVFDSFPVVPFPYHAPVECSDCSTLSMMSWLSCKSHLSMRRWILSFEVIVHCTFSISSICDSP